MTRNTRFLAAALAVIALGPLPHAPAAAQHPSFMEYCQAIYPDFVFPQHFEVAAEQVEKLLAGSVTRAQTNSPPQYGSTTLALLGLAGRFQV